jgi:hypothetical protein
MAEVYLGLTTSGAILLPPIRWMDGNAPALPVDYSKQIEKASMLDGANRFNYKSEHPRRWQFSWEALTTAELADFIALNEYNHNLQFLNGWEDIGWREVFMTSFEYAPAVNIGPVGCRYAVAITLEEAI